MMRAAGASAASAPTAARWPLRGGHRAAPPGLALAHRRRRLSPAQVAAAAADGGAGGSAAAARRLGLSRTPNNDPSPASSSGSGPQVQQQQLQHHHTPRPWPGRGGGGGAGAGRMAGARSRSRSRSRRAPPGPMQQQQQHQAPAPPLRIPASAPPKLPEAVDWDDMPTGLAVTWLGTSSGAPSLHRNISCTVLRHRPAAGAAAATARGNSGNNANGNNANGNNATARPPNAFIVDAGEGSARQLSRTGVDLSGARALLITHLHGDHCFGLGSLAAACLTARRAAASAAARAEAGGEAREAREPLLIVGPPGVHDLVAAQLLATGLMRSLLPDDDDYEEQEQEQAQRKKRAATTAATAANPQPAPLLHVIELVELPGDAVAASPSHAWRKHAAACALAGAPAAASVVLERLPPRRGERPDAELRARLKGSSLVPPEQRRVHQQQWQQPQGGYNNNNGYNNNGYNNHNNNHHHHQAPPPQPTAGQLDADTGNGARPPPYTAKPGLVWDVPVPEGCGARVQAAQLQHRVPCWGYVWEEDPPAAANGGGGGGSASSNGNGKQRQQTQQQQQQQQSATAARRRGLLPHGADASSLLPSPGRKVVLLGDTVDSSALAPLALGADLIAHEATFARGMEGKAAVAQHSTARMAGCFARAVGARRLVLTHFSARYDQAQQQPPAGGGAGPPGDGGWGGGRGGGGPRQQQLQRGGGAAGAGPGGGDAAAQQEQQAEEERAQRVAIDALRLEAAMAFVGGGAGAGGGGGGGYDGYAPPPPPPAEALRALARVDAACDFWSAHVDWPRDDDDDDEDDDGGREAYDGGAVQSMR